MNVVLTDHFELNEKLIVLSFVSAFVVVTSYSYAPSIP